MARNAVRVEGLEEVKRKFAHLANSRIVNKSLTDYAIKVQGDVTPYPKQTEANFPPEPYYKRGVGTVTKSGVRHTSERLGDKWRVKSSTRSVELLNAASYSGFVQGKSQSRWHWAIGWKQAHVRASQMLDELHNIFRRNLLREWTRG